MVKNNTGGNKSKGFARKNLTKRDSALRFAKEDGEIYAQAVKVMGGAFISAIDVDGNPLRGHIRGKFRGRGKRDNFISPNTWLLVGLHEWGGNSAINDCDILEVYTDADKHKLKNTATHINWSLFITNDSKTFNSESTTHVDEEQGIKFSTEDNTELEQLIASQLTRDDKPFVESDAEVDVDDI